MSQVLVALSTVLAAVSVPSPASLTSPAVVFVALVSFLFSSSLPDLVWIYNLEALESSSACIIGSLLLLLLIDGLGWIPKVKSQCRTTTHRNAFGKMEVYRAASPVLIPTLLSGSFLVSDDICLIVRLAVEISYVDRCVGGGGLGSISSRLGDFVALWCGFNRFGLVFGHRNKFFRLVWRLGWWR